MKPTEKSWCAFGKSTCTRFLLKSLIKPTLKTWCLHQGIIMLSKLSFSLVLENLIFFIKKVKIKIFLAYVLIQNWILKILRFCAKNFRCNLLKNPGAPLANRSAPGIFSSTLKSSISECFFSNDLFIKNICSSCLTRKLKYLIVQVTKRFVVK